MTVTELPELVPARICDQSDHEVILVRGDVEARIKSSEDSVMIIDLGRAGD
jgi:hypothetical protein